MYYNIVFAPPTWISALCVHVGHKIGLRGKNKFELCGSDMVTGCLFTHFLVIH